jgi:hypothetical protein
LTAYPRRGKLISVRGIDGLSEDWRIFGETECGEYSPLYASICRSVADDAELLGLAASAPATGQQPNVLLAAVHYLVLSGLNTQLSEVYAGRRGISDAPALFREAVLGHRDAVARLLATRRTQTNEPGRAALLALGLVQAAAVLGEPIGVLDAGCSAGLNLLLDRYRYDYGAAGVLGPADSPVTVGCALSGVATVPARLPVIAERHGIDLEPVDLSDADDARWLLACVWPDTGRLPRTAAAIELARRSPPPVSAGDMVADLDAALDRFDPALPVVVTTTSAIGYLDEAQRRDFVAILRRRGIQRRLAWVTTDPVGLIDLFPAPPVRRETLACTLGLAIFDGGEPAGRTLGVCHSHGAWLEWTDPAWPH